MRFTLVLCLFTLFILSSCSPKPNISQINPIDPLEQVFLSAAKFPGKAFSHNVYDPTYKLNYGLKIRPSRDTSSSKPLVVALHWAGGGDNFEIFYKCLIEPVFGDSDYHLVIPDAQGLVWTSEYSEQKVLNIKKYASSVLKVDEDRVLVTGYSNGGNGTWYFAENFPEQFTAAIPMAAAYKTNLPLKMPVYCLHGTRDELFPIKQARDHSKDLMSKGVQIEFVELDRAHKEACTFVEELKTAKTWIDNIWNKPTK